MRQHYKNRLSYLGIFAQPLEYAEHSIFEGLGNNSLVSRETPTVVADDRVAVTDLGEGFYRITVGYGFMESPDISTVIEQLSNKGLSVDIYSTSFFLGRENLLATGPAPMAQWRKHLFIFMSRNAWNASSFFKIPPDRVVELGSQVQL